MLFLSVSTQLWFSLEFQTNGTNMELIKSNSVFIGLYL